MKNRKLHSFAAYACGLLLTLVMTSTFVSCSDDEDDDGGGGTTLMITSLTPAKARVGETVTITGTGFGTTPSQNTVMFKSTQANDAPALVQEATATTLKVTVPVSAASGSITVTVAGKSVTSPEPFTVDESLGAPVLTSLNPTSGFVNTEITITGSSFGTSKDAVDVMFGAVEATEIVAVTGTTVKVKVPTSLSAGTVDVKVVRDGVSSGNTLQFTVNATPVSVKTVYWIDANTVYRGEIGEEGVNITEVYNQEGRTLQGVAIDAEGGYIYWGRAGGVSRAPLDGAGPVEDIYTDASKLAGIGDIAVDPADGAIYFTSIDASNAHSYINKGSLDGATDFTVLVEQDFALVGFNIKLAVGDGVLYWASPLVQEVSKASLSGTFTPVVLFTAADGLKGPNGVAVDKASGKIFVTDNGELTGMGESTIMSGNLDGSGALTSLVPAGSNVRFPYDTEIDTDNGYIFWLNATTDGGSASDIMRVKLDGTDVEKLFDGFDSGTNFDIDVR